MKMQRFLGLLVCAALCAALFGGCGGGNAGGQSSAVETAADGEAPPASTEPSNTGEAGDSSAAADADQPVPAAAEPDGPPAVYFTGEISSEALITIYRALGLEASGKVAVKVTTGEPGGSNFLQPAFMADLVGLVDGTIVECNTAYGGQRASTALHYQVAEDHGFTAIADVHILDENGSIELPVPVGVNLAYDLVGAGFADYDFHIVLSHFKGHAMGGFGGAIKNMSIGYASSQGKSWIHTGGTGTSGIMGDQDAFLESMAEAASAVAAAADGNILYISVMNRMSVDCDCSSSPAEPDMHDIGILASLDPVALDQACVDLVYAAPDGASLVERIESRNGLHTLEHADAIGFGSREYRMVPIDG